MPEEKAESIRAVEADHYVNIRLERSLRHSCECFGLPEFPFYFGQYFYELAKIIKKINTNVVLIIIWKGKKICFYNDEGCVFDKQKGYVIEIDQCELIDDLLRFFDDRIYHSKDCDGKLGKELLNRDVAGRALRDLPIEDLRSPINHIRRIVHHYILDSFGAIDERWASVGKIKVRRDVSWTDMEGVYELNFAIDDREEPKFSSQLPSVRYGFVEGEEARIYAVQTPKCRYFSKKAAIEELSKREEQLALFVTYLADWQSEDPNTFNSLFGPGFDAEKFKKDFDAFREWFPSDITAEMVEAAYDRDKGTILGRGFLNGANKFLEQCDVGEALEHFEKMEGVWGKTKAYFDNGIPGNLRGAPPAMLTSLCVSIYLLHGVGVKDVVMPLKMPFREKSGREGEKANEKIFNQMRKLAQRLAFEIEGLEIVQDVEKYPSTGNTTIKLKMAESIYFRSAGIRQLLELES